MESGYTEVGAFEAKTRLSEILRKVQQGEKFTITVRGQAVADVIPRADRDRRQAQAAVKRLLAMPRVLGVSAETVKQWIEAGRE
ncbi:type II toxin-antitoxin system Phd/YefM family antitoxin [Telmatobacter bradus]|uniref:type II toxin-antitoxin system Phd/YefM family antitoxin n=1 Tax=Telmatobacter bradus TaxID=474953 RepID=UPI003B439B6B